MKLSVVDCRFSMRIKHDNYYLLLWIKWINTIVLFFSFFSSNPAGHSRSNKAWKIGCLVLVLLLATAIVVIMYMCFKYCKVTHAPQGDAVNNGNGIEIETTNIGQKVNSLADNDDHNDEDDDEMLNLWTCSEVPVLINL